MRSLEEIEDLKALWLDDPWFDLEDEVGFEEHREELREWRLRFEEAFDEYEGLELDARARQNGRTTERQKAVEEAVSTERYYKRSAHLKFGDLYSALGLRRSDLSELLEGLIEDLLTAAEARARLVRLKELATKADPGT